MDIAQLATKIKTSGAPMTQAQMMALDNSYLCQNPGQAIQQLRAAGYPITITTDANGQPAVSLAA